MAKGSVRKKGKKWYYRYYVEDASGNLVQKECVGTESKSETEKLLRKAMEEYESKKIVAKTENIALGELLDVWVDEELKVSSLSNNTVTLYLGVVKIIKRHPLSKRKLRTVTSEHMQEFMDYLSFGGTAPDGTEAKPLSIDRIHSFSAVLQRAFRYAVFPKQYISFNPMQYVVIRRPTQEVDLFATEDVIVNKKVPKISEKIPHLFFVGTPPISVTFPSLLLNYTIALLLHCQHSCRVFWVNCLSLAFPGVWWK